MGEPNGDVRVNGIKENGTDAEEVKTPFLIGVAGGTASGKVWRPFRLFLELQSAYLDIFPSVDSMQTYYGTVGAGRYGSHTTTGRLRYFLCNTKGGSNWELCTQQ